MKATVIDKGLDEQRCNAIAVLPVALNLTHRLAEDMGGEMGNLDLGMEEKPAITQDSIQIGAPGGLIPANRLIPRRHSPGCGAKGQSPQRPMN